MEFLPVRLRRAAGKGVINRLKMVKLTMIFTQLEKVVEMP